MILSGGALFLAQKVDDFF